MYNYIHNSSNFVVGETYYFDLSKHDRTTITPLSFSTNKHFIISNINVIEQTFSADISSTSYFSFWKNNTMSYFGLYFYDVNNNYLTGIESYNNSLIFSFDFVSTNFNEDVFETTDMFYQVIETQGILGSYSLMLTDYLGVSLGVIVGILSLFCLFKIALGRK